MFEIVCLELSRDHLTTYPTKRAETFPIANGGTSPGYISKTFLTGELGDFYAEKDELLKTGLSVSHYVHTDDTGARHIR